MNPAYLPQNSEVLCVIGAGATAALGMPSTDSQTKIFRSLCDDKKSKKEILKDWFSDSDLEKIVKFLELLDGTENNQILVSEQDIKNAGFIYKCNDKKLLRNRILTLRQQYDWNAAKKVLKICPKNDASDNLVRDVYSIIDSKLLSGQSLEVQNQEIIPASRLQGARNFLTLFINMLFSAKWYKICNGEKSEEFSIYKKFISAFDRMIQNESSRFYQKYEIDERNFYLFTTSFVSFNFEMVFSWLFMNSHYELNHHKTYIDGRPLRLWLDYGCEHRGRKTKDGKIVSTLEFTEAVASRENEDAHIGSELNRCGKFYFAHGSSNWRECPICGRMTFYFGYSDRKWNYKSKELIPLFPIPIFETEKMNALTKKEEEWRKNLEYDALQCMLCGAKTLASDSPMIMQTMYKSTPTSFLEEIQRDVKIAINKARHIVLFGYRLPPDDTIWQHAFSEGVKSRDDSENAAFCSVVVGTKGEKRWLSGDELQKYISLHKSDGDGYGVDAIENAIAIFGVEKVRAFTGGIPQVFGNCTESDVRDLFYPDWVIWNGTRVEKNLWISK